MDKVQKPSNSVCYTPWSEPYRIYYDGYNVINLDKENVVIQYVYYA
jgi:hypothetical protein